MRYILAFSILLIAASSPHASALDIRTTPLPSVTAATVSTQFGYTTAQAKGMLDLTQKELWSLVPPNPTAWTTSTYALRTRMNTALGTQGFDSPLANVIINSCKVYARDARHCVIFASAVACAESSCGQTYSTSAYAIFGLKDSNSQPIKYSSRTHAVIDWVKRYNVSWFVADEGYFYGFCKKYGSTFLPHCDNVGTDYYANYFYSNKKGRYPASNYCGSESGSSTPGYCPNGFANSKAAYLKVK
ncbi:MAG: hypothetical protein ABJC13_07665 [Acidobacteriota bacterium]